MKRTNQPPKWILRWLEGFCDPYLLEGIMGDLDEVYEDNLESKGTFKARLLYIIQALGFMRFIFKKKNKKASNMKAIWTNYLLTSYRSLKRNKLFFGINLVGLVTAITCALFATIYIYDELQFDKQHQDADQIFRLYKHWINPAENIDHFTFETSGMMGPTMMEEYAQIEESLRICPWFDKATISTETKNIISEHIYYADSNFFDFFDFEVVAGNSKEFLTAPSTMVISEDMAKALFDEENPIGQTVVGLNDVTYTITGIFKNIDRRSTMYFDVLISWATTVPGVGPNQYRWMNNWLGQAIFTFVKLSKDANPDEIEKELPDMMQRHFEERADQYFLKFQPLTKMHLHGDEIQNERGMRKGSIKFVTILGASALLILLISLVNYINIAVSRASKSRLEVGMRKVMGSNRRQLMGRFIVETLLSIVIALVISLGLLALGLPRIGQLVDKELPYSLLIGWFTLPVILIFSLIILLIAGLYPAYILSRPQISLILKGGSQVAKTGLLRKLLLTLQFGISIFLIVCTIGIINQTNYLINQPLGFEKEQVLVIDTYNEVGEKIAVFEDKLSQHPNINAVSVSRHAIGSGSYSTTAFPEGSTEELTVRIFGVDAEFYETFGIKTNQGRTFLPNSNADSSNLIINQEFADFMGWDDAIGKHIRFSEDGEALPVIGVIDNFHYFSLATNKIEPMVMYHSPEAHQNTAVRIGSGDVIETIDYINEVWDEMATRTSLDFYFVDKWFESQYKKETQLLSMASSYAVISLILCALGLYGLTSLILQQRKKEISIRKVLGAPLSSIIALINKEFVIIIGIGFLLAAPLAYYLIIDWLDQFAYKSVFGGWPFIIAISAVAIVSIVIISILSTKTANSNPSEVLSNE